MLTNRFFNAEQLTYRIRCAVSGIPMLNVFADEATPATTEGNPTPTPTAPQMLNYEDLIARARQEEKDKLYPRIKKAEGELEKQIKINNDLLIKNATLAQENESLKSAQKAPDPRVGELETENSNLKKRILELEASAPDEKKIREQVEAEYEVKLYAQQKKAAVEKDGSVLPTFLDSIKGSTKEEVDAAVTNAVNSTVQIKKDLGLIDDQGNPVTTTPSTTPSTTPAAQTTTAPSVNPTDNGGIESYSAEYIRGLDPSSEEYKQLRKKLGFK